MESKKDAKKVARRLNNLPIMFSKKKVLGHWNIRYLRGFTWYDLTAARRAQEKYLEMKLKMSIAKAKKEANYFLDNVAHDQQYRKRKRKFSTQENDQNHVQEAEESEETSARPLKKTRKMFKQRENVKEEPKELNEDFFKKLLGDK
eukprot:TRINITY_DN11844_c0_g1_i1.p1 TRINITY_DN11844_c0_g1~~TRINITY_DN11844_c0_g1_i1.p1  ORF type:complete len:146 (+),score=26.21 TRINITY_DN11844_c0_g1_i1:90-527(+)